MFELDKAHPDSTVAEANTRTLCSLQLQDATHISNEYPGGYQMCDVNTLLITVFKQHRCILPLVCGYILRHRAQNSVCGLEHKDKKQTGGSNRGHCGLGFNC